MNGGGKCDGASVLEQQRFEIMDHYLDSAGMLAYSNDGLASDDSSNRDIVSILPPKKIVNGLKFRPQQSFFKG